MIDVSGRLARRSESSSLILPSLPMFGLSGRLGFEGVELSGDTSRRDLRDDLPEGGGVALTLRRFKERVVNGIIVVITRWLDCSNVI